MYLILFLTGLFFASGIFMAIITGLNGWLSLSVFGVVVAAILEGNR